MFGRKKEQQRFHVGDIVLWHYLGTPMPMRVVAVFEVGNSYLYECWNHNDKVRQVLAAREIQPLRMVESSGEA